MHTIFKSVEDYYKDSWYTTSSELSRAVIIAEIAQMERGSNPVILQPNGIALEINVQNGVTQVIGIISR